MKTVTCDICGFTKEDLRTLWGGKIYRFKVSILEEPVRIKKFDVCNRCLSKIAEEISSAKAGGQE